LPGESLYFPAAQAVQSPPFAPEYPALQIQLSNTLLAGGACEFAVHALHVLSPVPEKVLAAHGTQLSSESEISVAENRPAPHAEHCTLFDSELKNPAVHA